MVIDTITRWHPIEEALTLAISTGKVTRCFIVLRCADCYYYTVYVVFALYSDPAYRSLGCYYIERCPSQCQNVNR